MLKRIFNSRRMAAGCYVLCMLTFSLWGILHYRHQKIRWIEEALITQDVAALLAVVYLWMRARKSARKEANPQAAYESLNRIILLSAILIGVDSVMLLMR